MVFSSLIFLYAFFPLCLLAYTLCRTLRAKNICLLVFSLLFYAWGEPVYVLLLAVMALFDWYFALRVQRAREENGNAKKFVVLTCIVNLGLIGFFKYAGMICSVFGAVPAFVQKIALPLGISFYTFQLLSYVVDVYRGDAEAQEKYWQVLLYAALFHQCVAGPIVRYKTVAEELFAGRDEHSDRARGCTRFCVGLAKKTVLANACGSLADKLLLTDAAIGSAAQLSENLSALSGAPALGLWVGVIAYAFQIYFDFSAYSDMAIGMGQMIGLHYLENFNYPYISRTATEFWRRWHMSLGTFFRDYVYIPLGGNRRGKARTVLNLLIVWALTGLWHGASWNFVLWGLYYFVLLLIDRLFWQRLLDRLPKAVSAVLSHIILPLAVLFGWVLFKFTSLPLMLAVVRGMFCANGNPFTSFTVTAEIKSHMYLLLFCALASTPVFSALAKRWERAGMESALARKTYGIAAYGAAPVALLLLSTACLVGNSFNPFLYFRF